jgi:hypothetical protein
MRRRCASRPRASSRNARADDVPPS